MSPFWGLLGETTGALLPAYAISWMIAKRVIVQKDSNVDLNWQVHLAVIALCGIIESLLIYPLRLVPVDAGKAYLLLNFLIPLGLRFAAVKNFLPQGLYKFSAGRSEAEMESRRFVAERKSDVTSTSKGVAKPSQSRSNNAHSDIDELYEVVGGELEAGKAVKSLWTRAYSEAEGHPDRTKALYIKLRVDQLSRSQDAAAAIASKSLNGDPKNVELTVGITDVKQPIGL